MTGTKVEAVLRHGAGAPDMFVVGRVLAVAPHPDADRLRVCEVDVGLARDDGPATIVCGAPNVAAGQSVAVALPGARVAGGATLEATKLRGVRSEGMILAEDELGIGGDRRRDPRARRARRARRPGTRSAARRGPAARHRRARARDHAQPPRLSGRLRRRARAARRDRSGARAGALAGGPGLRGADRGRRGARGVPGPLPALHRPSLRGGAHRTLAAVVEGAPERGRAAADQQRRRHHQLRDAPDRAAAARVRLRPRRRRAAHRASRASGRARADARRPDAQARPRDDPDRGRRGADLDRRRDGRSALGGLRRDHLRAARGGQLGRPQHPSHRLGARAAQRGLGAVREGPAAGGLPLRPGGRLAAHDRHLRRRARAGHDRRRRSRCRRRPS